MNFVSPSLKDPVEEGFEDVMLTRSTYVIMLNDELEPVEDFIYADILTNAGADLSWIFRRAPRTLQQELELVMCYTYQDVAAL